MTRTQQLEAIKGMSVETIEQKKEVLLGKALASLARSGASVTFRTGLAEDSRAQGWKGFHYSMMLGRLFNASRGPVARLSIFLWALARSRELERGQR